MRLALAFSLLAGLSLATPALAVTSMERPISFAAAAAPGGALVIPAGSAADLGRIASLDSASRAWVERTAASQAFGFTAGSTLALPGIGPWSQVVLVGTGGQMLTAKALQDVGGRTAQAIASVNGPITIDTTALRSGIANPEVQVAIGARLGGYRFDKYKYVDPAAANAAGKTAPITIIGSSPGAAAAYARDGQALSDSVRFARDLVNEPPNYLYPETFVDRTRAAFTGVGGVTIEVLDVARMRQLGMGSILSVGQGSQRPPRMLIVSYQGASGAPPIALVGKGITFDTGGNSIKPSSGMWAMKGDMGGAAAVVAATLSLARSQAPVNVIAIAALAENMPGSTATRPGDVVKAHNGRTIEILNTDAEGRLVLADAVAYAERRYRPAAIVDVATLTGAVGVALGDEYAGLFSRNDALAAQLLAAGDRTGEDLWRLPLHENYATDMKSDVADIKNVVEGGGPGAGLGAHFIGYFVDSTPWAHLDIAGVDLLSSGRPTVPKGFSAFGVRLLDRFVRDFRPVQPVVQAGIQ